MMGAPLWAALLGLGMMLAMMTALWAAHLKVRNAAVVDVGWAAGLGLLALLYAAMGTAGLPMRLLMAAMAAIWSFRLAWHLYRDRLANGAPEEGRYVYLRSHWGERANPNFLYFFLVQGLLDTILSLPFLLVAFQVGDAPGPVAGVAAALWLSALIGESAADAQLKSFKADPANRGKVCRRGLWNLSRHPNYFFEWLIWCSFALLAAASASDWTGWLGWISPALILFLLLKVSGIPFTEKQALRSRGAAYARYQQSVNAFFPWFPRGQKDPSAKPPGEPAAAQLGPDGTANNSKRKSP